MSLRRPRAKSRPEASQASTSNAINEDLLNRLKQTFPASRLDSVLPTAVPGLYEVVSGPNVFYVESSGRYFLFGKLFDMETRTDVTAARTEAVQRTDVSALPHKYAIKHTRGNGKRVLYVFADPNCGFCKSFEKTLVELHDVTIYTYVIPLLGADSRDKARSIWCSPDRARAWSDWMLRGIPPKPARDGCEDPIDLNAELAEKLQIGGTPIALSPDGRRLIGAVSSEQLATLLQPPVSSANVSINATR